MRRLPTILTKGGAAAAALACVLGGVPAFTATASASAMGFDLPQRWNDDYKPGTHCSSPGYTGTYLTATNKWFKQTDATSVSNANDFSVPVTHKVTEKREETVEVSLKATGKGELAKYFSQTFGFHYVETLYWKLDQVVGPYNLPAGSQGRLVWGFLMLDADAQDVRCSRDQTWEPVGGQYKVSMPEARYSELRIGEQDF